MPRLNVVVPVDHFPHPESAGPEGLLAIGGDLHPQSLLKAYRAGIFPWPMEGLPLTWFSPPQRAVVFFEKLHIPRRLEQKRRKNKFRFTVNEAFEKVIRACAEVERPIDPQHHGQAGPSTSFKTWITPEMIKGYCRLHEMGHAHSIEVWEERKLMGGIYGVQTEGCFSCESMFYRKSDASKLALLKLIDELRDRGFYWMDIQMMTPHMLRMGAELISRGKFLSLIEETAELRPRPLSPLKTLKAPWE